MQRLCGISLPLLAAVAMEAIPTIPTLHQQPLASGIVAVDDGTVYFVDSFHNAVWRLQPNGAVSAFVTGRSGRTLQADVHGNVFGSHQDGRGRVGVWRADPSGNVTELQRSLPDAYNHAFAVSERGEVIGWTGGGRRSGVRLLRNEEHTQQLVAGGERGMRDGQGSDARFFAIGAMARTAAGDLIVTSGSTVRRVDPLGNVTTIAAADPLLRPRGGLLGRLFGPVESHLTSVAVATNGDIYVINSTRESLVVITRDGSTREVLGADGGWTPTGVTTANGVVYVLEYGPGVRVRRLGSGGIQVVALVRSPRVLAAPQLSGRFAFTGRMPVAAS